MSWFLQSTLAKKLDDTDKKFRIGYKSQVIFYRLLAID